MSKKEEVICIPLHYGIKQILDYGYSIDILANVKKGQIAKVFGQESGTQIQFGTSVSVYELLGLLKEIV